MFDSWYEVNEEEKDVFGDKWCGPNSFSEYKKTLIARFSKMQGSDGHDVEVYCSAAPARFYEVKALDTIDSTGHDKKGFSLSSGSGLEMAKFMAELAHNISIGMIGFSD